MTRNPATVALAAVMYSPNLGDGVIAECLSNALHSEVGAATTWLDLAGRTQFETGGMGARGVKLRILNRMPRIASAATCFGILSVKTRVHSRRRWEPALAGCESLIVGGGNLLSDKFLNFPTKIAAVADAAEQHHLPFCLYGVGAADNWSRWGGALFARVFRSPNLVAVSVRDEESKFILERRLSRNVLAKLKVSVVPDPGTLASEVYRAARAPLRDRPLVGLCLAHPEVLKTHTEEAAHSRWSGLGRRLVELVRILVRQGFDVVLLTNGDSADHIFARRLGEEVAKQLDRSRVSVSPRPTRPSELVDMIAGLDALIGYRLHANIVGYSFKVPRVALGWDRKMEAFHSFIGEPRFLLDGDVPDPAMVVDRLNEAIDSTFDTDRHREILQMARQGVRSAVSALRAAVR